MFNKFATAAFAATVSATETEMFQGGSPDGYGIQHGQSFSKFGAETGVSGQSYGNGVESFGAIHGDRHQQESNVDYVASLGAVHGDPHQQESYGNGLESLGAIHGDRHQQESYGRDHQSIDFGHQDRQQDFGSLLKQDDHQSLDLGHLDRQPHQDVGSLLKQDSSFGRASLGGRGVERQGPSFGHLGGRFGAEGLTYGHEEPRGYGLYQRGNLPKVLRANDGYLVRARTDPHKRYSEPVYAKCALSDPEEESYISGLVRLQQGGYDEKTRVWATVSGAGYGEINIHALGDVRDGCDSIGEIFNPAVSASGYGHGYEPKSAPGMLGAIGQHGFEGAADVDLSGTWSVIGRSMAVTVGEHRVACCTIGLVQGPKKAEPVYVAPVVHQQAYAPQQDYRNERDFGYGQEFLAPRNYH